VENKRFDGVTWKWVEVVMDGNIVLNMAEIRVGEFGF
jgi:hypothetical protein